MPSRRKKPARRPPSPPQRRGRKTAPRRKPTLARKPAKVAPKPTPAPSPRLTPTPAKGFTLLPQTPATPTSTAALKNTPAPLIAVIMGSKSDLKYMQAAVDLLKFFEIPHEVRILSAHRTPDMTLEYSASAERRGLEVIIAGAGGAAHLAGVVAAKTILPVLGVPIPSTSLNGMDSLLSIVQMPRGIPVGTLAIGESGAANAALFAAAIISRGRPEIRNRLRQWRQSRADEVMRDSVVRD